MADNRALMRCLLGLCTAAAVALVVSPAVAAANTLVIQTGDGQTTDVGTAFATKLTVELTDGAGNSVSGVHVAFSAPGAGASSNLSSTDVVTAANGRATVTATANATAGFYQVQASAPGPLTAQFSEGNVPSGLSVGEKLTDIVAADQNGTLRHVSELVPSGGYALLTICGRWCTACRQIAPSEVAVEQWAAAKGIPFRVVPLLLEGGTEGTPSVQSDAGAWQAITHLTDPVLQSGGSTSSALYQDGTFLQGLQHNWPTSMLVGPDGTILDRVIGTDTVTARETSALEARLVRFVNPHENYRHAATGVPVGDGAQASAVGDVNGDGQPDIVTAVGNGLSLDYRNADNTGFVGPQTITVGNGPTGVALGPASALGTASGSSAGSIFATNFFDSTVTVLRAAGVTEDFVNFGAPITIPLPAGSSPVGIAVGDVNGDGLPDIVTANYGTGTLSLILRKGDDSAFLPAQQLTVGAAPFAVAIGDVNGDGLADLVSANNGDNTVSVLTRNAANSGWDARVNYAVGDAPTWVDVADLNGDGRSDIVTSDSGSNTLTILPQNVAGAGFDSPQSIAVGNKPGGVAVGDVNGDGRPDLVSSNFNDNTVSLVLRNAANSGFDLPVTMPVGVAPQMVALADVNADGKLDILTPNFGSGSDTPPLSLILGADDVGAPVTIDDLPTSFVPRAPIVHLTATDTGGALLSDPTGVAAIKYLIGPAPADPANPANNPLTYDPAHPPVLHDGEQIRYSAVDNIGNVEPSVTSAAAQVDGVAPHTSDDVPTAPVSGPVTVTLTATDARGSSRAASGVAAIHYQVGADPADPSDPASNPLTYDPSNRPVVADGQRIRYSATDNAGNVEGAATSAVVHVVIPPPVTTPVSPPIVLAAPKITKLSQSHATWRLGTARASLAKAKAKAKPPTGTTFSFTLNEAASLSFSFTQTSHGKTTTVAKLTKTGGKAGANRLAFAGRVSSSKKLRAGRYTLKIVATANGGTSAPAAISFTIAG